MEQYVSALDRVHEALLKVWYCLTEVDDRGEAGGETLWLMAPRPNHLSRGVDIPGHILGRRLLVKHKACSARHSRSAKNSDPAWISNSSPFSDSSPPNLSPTSTTSWSRPWAKA